MILHALAQYYERKDEELLSNLVYGLIVRRPVGVVQ